MRNRYPWLSLMVLISLTVPAFGKPVEGTFRFELYRGYLMVAHGSAGPLDGLRFLLDTGASPSILDPRIAGKLQLDMSPAHIAVVGGSVAAEQAIAPSLKVGPVERDNVPVLIEDLSFLEKALPFRVDGIIGLDILGQSAFLIDYAAQEIHFGPYPAMPVSVGLRMAGGLAIVDAEVNRLPAHLLLDTGTSSLILFARMAPSRLDDMKISATRTIGEFARKEVRLRSMRLGDAELGPQPAAVVSQKGYPFDGLLNPAELGIKQVVIDLARGEMGLRR